MIIYILILLYFSQLFKFFATMFSVSLTGKKAGVTECHLAVCILNIRRVGGKTLKLFISSHVGFNSLMSVYMIFLHHHSNVRCYCLLHTQNCFQWNDSVAKDSSPDLVIYIPNMLIDFLNTELNEYCVVSWDKRVIILEHRNVSQTCYFE